MCWRGLKVGVCVLLLNRAKTCLFTKGKPLQSLPRGRGKQTQTQADSAGLTFYPHLTGEGEVRFMFGRKLSSPMGPWGFAALQEDGKKNFFLVLLPAFLFPFALCFVVFPAVIVLVFRGTTCRVEVPVSLLVCNTAFYLQLSSHVFVSSSHNTDC